MQSLLAEMVYLGDSGCGRALNEGEGKGREWTDCNRPGYDRNDIRLGAVVLQPFWVPVNGEMRLPMVRRRPYEFDSNGLRIEKVGA